MESPKSSALSEQSRRASLFGPADVAGVFGADFLDPDRCTAFVLAWLHPEPARCPRCGRQLEGRLLESFRSFGRVHCQECGKFFTATTGTALHKVKLSPRQIILIAYLLGLGVDLAEIARAAEVEPETVRLWRLKFQAFEEER